MGSCAAPSAKGDDKFITTDYLQQCRQHHRLFHQELRRLPCLNETDEHEENTVKPSIHAASASLLGELLINILNCDRVQIHTHKKTSSLALERFLADLITINYEAQKK